MGGHLSPLSPAACHQSCKPQFELQEQCRLARACQGSGQQQLRKVAGREGGRKEKECKWISHAARSEDILMTTDYSSFLRYSSFAILASLSSAVVFDMWLRAAEENIHSDVVDLVV